jgi:hypothetical protein
MLRHALDSLLAAVPLLKKLSPNLPEQALQATDTDSMRSWRPQIAVACAERTLADFRVPM